MGCPSPRRAKLTPLTASNRLSVLARKAEAIGSPTCSRLTLSVVPQPPMCIAELPAQDFGHLPISNATGLACLVFDSRPLDFRRRDSAIRASAFVLLSTFGLTRAFHLPSSASV